MRLAKSGKSWQRPVLPAFRGGLTIADVLAAPPGPVRDARLRDWCQSVWTACRPACPEILLLAHAQLGVTP